MNIRSSIAVIKSSFCNYFAAQTVQNSFPRKCIILVWHIRINQRDIFQHVPITSRKPVKPDSKGVPGFFAFWGSSRILANPGAS